MIKMVLGGQNGERKLLLLGLTRANVTRLVAGEPIYIDAEPLGLVHPIAICFGEDQTAILRDVKNNLGVEVPDLGEPGPGEEFVMTPEDM